MGHQHPESFLLTTICSNSGITLIRESPELECKQQNYKPEKTYNKILEKHVKFLGAFWYQECMNIMYVLSPET